MTVVSQRRRSKHYLLTMSPTTPNEHMFDDGLLRRYESLARKSGKSPRDVTSALEQEPKLFLDRRLGEHRNSDTSVLYVGPYSCIGLEINTR